MEKLKYEMNELAKVVRHEVKPYGCELILDLHRCNPATFTRHHLNRYFTELCDLIDMEKCEVYFWDDVGVPPQEHQTLPVLTTRRAGFNAPPRPQAVPLIAIPQPPSRS